MEESLKKLHKLTDRLDPNGPNDKKVPKEIRLWISARKQTIVIRRVPDGRVPA